MNDAAAVAHVLVADDEEGLRSFLVASLSRDGHDVTAVADGAAALAELRAGDYDVLVTDLRMPALSGLQLLESARAEQPRLQVIVLTAFGDVASAVSAMKLGAFDYVEKPIESPAALRALVRGALERQRALCEEAPRRHDEPSGEQLTFGAPSMQPVVDAITRVARTAATVLLQGESGTGKEVAARAIHAASARARGPFVAINCAVLSENLLESELFGHEKGAFTGAVTARKGRLELAEGGTFFLDEIGELRPPLQAKLLRVIEERAFERLGGGKSIKADVRWVSATHRDLRAMVREGSFRDDLYHRLSVFPIRLPPLRERRDDIAPLARKLLASIATRTPTPRLTRAAEARLAAADWPGNVRELRNVLERALILTDGDLIDDGQLPIEQEAGSPQGELSSLEALERAQIERVLASVGGNRREAAERLGIGLRTLYDKLKRHGLR